MTRVRKNYILFRNDEKGPVMAGSFSSMKRAREAVKEDAAQMVKRIDTIGGFFPSIEYTPDGGRLRMTENRSVDYQIRMLLEDHLSYPENINIR